MLLRRNSTQSLLGGLHQIIHMDVDVIVIFDVIHCGLSWDLEDDQACPLQAIICDVLHLLPHQALWLLPWFPVCWQQVFVFWTRGQVFSSRVETVWCVT